MVSQIPRACHSERSEESLFVFISKSKERGILRFAQNDMLARLRRYQKVEEHRSRIRKRNKIA